MAKRRIPAEWEKQQALLLAFPFEGKDWPGKFGAIQWAFVEYIKKVTSFQKLVLLVKSEEHKAKVADLLKMATVELAMIEFILLKTNRVWMRDSGPIIVYDEKGNREALQFGFNAWAKYKNYQLDRAVPPTVASHLNIPIKKVMYKGKEVVLEGGAIDYNGQGALLTTTECLLHPTIQVRNPGFTAQDYEAVFKDYLGIDQVIWLENGITGDDTHGHVDDLTRFVDVAQVVTVIESNSKDPNYGVLQRNLEILQGTTLLNGSKFEIIPLPMPKPLFFDGMRLPASYANFIIINDSVLMPTFNDPNDYQALGVLREAFPKREVIGINAIDLIWGLGTLHCLSHEIPK